MSEKWHGTSGGYSNHKCRCDSCRLAWNKYCSERKNKRRREYQFNPDDEHGLEKTYQRGCSCKDCKAGHAIYAAQIRRGEASKEGQCEICKTATRVIWDHDHPTGSHRGWLCINCNQGLGLFRDRLDLIEKAIRYLGGQIVG